MVRCILMGTDPKKDTTPPPILTQKTNPKLYAEGQIYVQLKVK